jgi:hypothetical protein
MPGFAFKNIQNADRQRRQPTIAGYWDDFRGPIRPESSFLHEAGHNTGLRLRRAAYNTNRTLAFQPNCQPNYQSVMNYLFRSRG